MIATALLLAWLLPGTLVAAVVIWIGVEARIPAGWTLALSILGGYGWPVWLAVGIWSQRYGAD